MHMRVRLHMQARCMQHMQATHIDKDDLKPALIGLSMVKGKMLLRKAPPSKEINDSDTFSFNDKFRSPHLKIKFAAAGAQKEVLSLPTAPPHCCRQSGLVVCCRRRSQAADCIGAGTRGFYAWPHHEW